MSRPPFSLTDEQARGLLLHVAPLLDRYPVNPHNHRPFVQAFIRAVHQVTNKLYGPDVYRRLLSAYAPGRGPSTATIASERDALARELSAAAASPAEQPSGPFALPAAPSAAPALDGSAIRSAFEDFMPQFARMAAQAGRDAQVEYLTKKLFDAERTTADAKASAARIAADLQAQVARAELLARELDASKSALTQQLQAVTALTEELKGQRLFAMQSIEIGRAETRAAKDRVAEMQARIDRLEMTIDQLRMVRGTAGAR